MLRYRVTGNKGQIGIFQGKTGIVEKEGDTLLNNPNPEALGMYGGAVQVH